MWKPNFQETIKKGFQYEIISDGESWLEMLEMRNVTTHTYDEEIFNTSILKITDSYYPEIEKLVQFFKNQLEV